MRIDSFTGNSTDPMPARTTTPGQNSFGQTLLMLERGMWPGAKAGASAVEAMPRQAPSAAPGQHPAESGANAVQDRPVAGGVPADHHASPFTIAVNATATSSAMPAWTALQAHASTDTPASPAYPLPLRASASTTATAHEEIQAIASGMARSREDTASMDHVMVAGDASSHAVVLRFDAPLEQRKALLDAVSAELRRRGQAHRPIVINGTTYTEHTRGKP